MSGHHNEKPTAGSREAMEVAESARQTEWQFPSFMGEFFMGRFKPELVFPYPDQPDADRQIGDAYLKTIDEFLRKNLDPDEVDRTGILPQSVIKGLVEIGAFRMKVPTEYGGMGFSQTNYGRIISAVSAYCGSTAVWLSAHQSIGVPQPLKLFGTDEQKKKFFPKLVNGAISGFALTEPFVGSDPAKMGTTAVLSEDGQHYIINGEKLWCTNGTVADILVVMARTPNKMTNGKERQQITAFIVEKDTPGFEVVFRCDFMGLKGIQNGLLKFTNMKVPKENVLWGEGNGLKLALITLNVGRLTVPAACTGMAKWCLAVARRWANERVQWGSPVGQHEATAMRLSRIASYTFAMESVSWLTSGWADRGGRDLRLEAAMSKLLCSEHGWRVVDDAVQVRGGRGYETGPSLKARGEHGYAVERMMRDSRINTIIEGTSEIMHLFIAREALDPHMRAAGDLVKPHASIGRKLIAAVKAGVFYAWWYPTRWLPSLAIKVKGSSTTLGHLDYLEIVSRKIARTIFYCMMRHQAGLERRQQVLARVVDIGVDAFAMTSALARAEMLVKKNPSDTSPMELADLYCREARRRMDRNFRDIWSNEDRRTYRTARNVLEGKLSWLEEGINFQEAPAQQPVTTSSK